VLYRYTSKDGTKSIGILQLPLPDIRNCRSTYTTPRIHPSVVSSNQNKSSNSNEHTDSHVVGMRDDESDEKVSSVPLTATAKKRANEDINDYMCFDDKLGKEGKSQIKQATHIIGVKTSHSTPPKQWVLPKSKKSYWGFQMFEDKVCYISNHNIIKIYDIHESNVVCRLHGHSHYILALEYVNNDYIVSLGSDKTVRVWKLLHNDAKKKQKITPRRPQPCGIGNAFIFKKIFQVILYLDICIKSKCFVS